MGGDGRQVGRRAAAVVVVAVVVVAVVAVVARRVISVRWAVGSVCGGHCGECPRLRSVGMETALAMHLHVWHWRCLALRRLILLPPPPASHVPRTAFHCRRRYLLKLFRDFLFHQVDEEGAPLADWGLVAEALNKVDAGVPEKVLLMSRDEASMLVVSYADVRRCLASCYDEVCALASTHYPQQQQQQPTQQREASGGGGGGLPRPRSRAGY